jgi:NAD(P)-dependent dehydrogenase (short-subunit alcohol dehydrogenase family)
VAERGSSSDGTSDHIRSQIQRPGKCSVVLVSSTRGRLGHPAGHSAYCPSKAAVALLAKSPAAEWGAQGIRVNALAPTCSARN